MEIWREREAIRSSEPMRNAEERTELFKGVFGSVGTDCMISVFFPLPPRKALMLLYALAFFLLHKKISYI